VIVEYKVINMIKVFSAFTGYGGFEFGLIKANIPHKVIGWSEVDNYITKGSKIRKLTPRECFRLQGFINDEINLDNLSDSQKYGLAGNGVSINVTQKIFEKLFRDLYE